MPDAVPERWQALQDAFSTPDVSLLPTLLLGGLLGLYLRWLYGLSAPQGAARSVARVFPLLTMVTIAVIAVVKTSLALSLGLVGALSIVRFRAAIKDPEELVYLFLCIGVWLALGAVEVWLGLALVLAATVFVLLFDRRWSRRRRGSAYLTITGDIAASLEDGSNGALSVVRSLCPRSTVERCDVDGEEGQLRVHVQQVDADAAPKLLSSLRERLPGCQISYINVEALP